MEIVCLWKPTGALPRTLTQSAASPNKSPSSRSQDWQIIIIIIIFALPIVNLKGFEPGEGSPLLGAGCRGGARRSPGDRWGRPA